MSGVHVYELIIPEGKKQVNELIIPEGKKQVN